MRIGKKLSKTDPCNVAHVKIKEIQDVGIDNLTKDDFEIKQGGKIIEITKFINLGNGRYIVE